MFDIRELQRIGAEIRGELQVRAAVQGLDLLEGTDQLDQDQLTLAMERMFNEMAAAAATYERVRRLLR